MTFSEKIKETKRGLYEKIDEASNRHNYDLVIELGQLGGRLISKNDATVLGALLEFDYSPEQRKAKYKFLIEAFNEGADPSSSWYRILAFLYEAYEKSNGQIFLDVLESNDLIEMAFYNLYEIEM
jgi:aspartyl-tRNA synthetase|tara:strand:- start:59 stop:433 length:375 start_codon:yes stop_codon:yes gene_type:complete